MPSASDELRDVMFSMFGDRIDESGPMNYLKEAGYVLNSNWYWTPPSRIKSYEDMTNEEFNCLMFLIQEWDFGGLDNVLYEKGEE